MAEMLKFVPKGDLLVRVPNAVQFIGQPPLYVGRAKRQLADGKWGYPANQSPYEAEVGSDIAQRLILLVKRDDCLWPFDETTAAACDTKFIAVEWIEGEWVPAKQPAKLKKVANEG